MIQRPGQRPERLLVLRVRRHRLQRLSHLSLQAGAVPAAGPLIEVILPNGIVFSPHLPVGLAPELHAFFQPGIVVSKEVLSIQKF
jgi:hypothetical protein